jgi:sarcosine oxidase subunit gamma
MTAGLARRSPLEGVRLPDDVRELPFLTQLDVRADPSELRGHWLPTEPNTVHAHGDRAALWLGPDEWLVVGPSDSAGAIESDLRASLGGAIEALVDVSANRTVLELTGPAARDLLEAGCSIDLDPRSFPPGRCAQTLLARANVILWHVDAAPTYRLFVRPSFAAYLAAWLTDAAE